MVLLKFLPQKLHLNVRGIIVSLLPDLLGFPLSLAEHENIAETDRSLYVTCDNSSFVSSFADSYPDLDDFTGYAGSADDLGYFGGC